MTGSRLVAVNELGRRIGEDHQNAVLTNHEVDLLLSLHEQGLGYGTLATMFDVSKSAARWICLGRNRGQGARGVRRIQVPETATNP